MDEKKKIAFYTLGCKLNFSETSQISRQFDVNKFEIVDFKEKADIYVINTCVVTEKAEKKSRSAIRQAKKRNPDAIIAAVGCYSELKPEVLSSDKETDVILGTSGKFALAEILDNLNNNIFLSNIESNLKDKFISSYSSGDRTRSFFKIQDGCDYFCSYCTVPFARGRSRSDTIENTLEKAREIASGGIKELILTGVNVGDFGRKNGEKFIDLLKKLDNIEGIERIRISSIEPDLLTNDIIEFVASSKKFLPHFHIPLQSASDKILLSMKRKYDTALFLEKIKLIKKYMPDCCIAIDLIVGFPGETDEYFEDSYKFIEDSDISYLHVFTYSERKNTVAATMNEVVPHIERTARSKKMLALSEKKKNTFYAENSGKEKYVLFESDNDKGIMYGFTENYIKVKTAFDPSLINQIKNVKLGKIANDGIFIV
ncbi:MAG: tRNA (N(6)-L-threonylcarbamoyladenosine(37)-C(2))-methylthiotransferase MtaB [Bacteroidetes bacterium]|nr:tRNA (N(6)-L-threonylcarbamoyladenosine(37)-C(2))-methylthiotransferase MtaB [Bacteroidota bacterium]